MQLNLAREELTLEVLKRESKNEISILLVIPPAKASPQWAPDLAVGYLAGSLRSLKAQGIRYKVEVLDCINRDFSDKDFKEEIKKRGRYDIIGLKVFSAYLSDAIKCLVHIKELYPDTLTVAGGPHVSVMKPEDVLDSIPELDYAIAGEGVRSFPKFVEMITKNSSDKKNVQGLIWRDGAEYLHNEPDFEVDIDFNGLPDWEAINPTLYKTKEPWSFYNTGWPVAQIVSSRGCPFKCSFCSSFKVLGRKVRYRSIDNIITEIKLLINNYGVKSFEFVDDNFLTDKKFTRELCQRMIDEKFNIEWSCPQGLHLAGADAKTISLMDKAGCKYIAVGVESGSDRVLKKVGKGLNRKIIVEKLKLIKKNSRIKIMGFFIIGLPTETETEIEETIKFGCELPLDLLTYSVYLYMPGTSDTERLLNEHPQYADLIKNFNKMYSYPQRMAVDIGDEIGGIPAERLNYYKQKGHRAFFLRPKVIFNILKELNSITKIKIIFRWIKMHFL